MVAWRNPRTHQAKPPTAANYANNSSTSEVHLEIPLLRQKWLQDVWVGRLNNLAMFDRLKEDMLWDFGVDIVPKYIGDHMVLLLGLTEEKARQMMEEDNERKSSVFYSLERWNQKVRVGYRLT